MIFTNARSILTPLLVLSAACIPTANAVWAHDPVFGAGPHVLFKDGVEVHLGAAQQEARDNRNAGAELELSYGITGDWSASIGSSYARGARILRCIW